MSSDRITIRYGEVVKTFTSGTDVTIGRDPACDVRVESPHVSRAHALVRTDADGHWELIDNGSTQGTWIGSNKVNRTTLRGSTEITLGQPGRGATVTVEVASAPADQSGTVPAVGATTQTPPTAQSPAIDGETVAATGAASSGGFRPGGELRLGGPAEGTVVTGDDLMIECGGRSYRFERGREAIIGRDAGCDVVSGNPTVSRRHARVFHDGSSWILTDLDSSGGTFVDGRRAGEVPLGGSTAVFLGDPDTGERVVLVASGERKVVLDGRSKRTSRAMLAIGALAFVAIALSAVVVVTRNSANEASSPAELAKASVRIIGDGWTGSGTIIDADKGLILTNAHVADPGAPGLAVQLNQTPAQLGDTPQTVQIAVSADEGRDAEVTYLGKPVVSDGYLDLSVVQITALASGAFLEDGDLDGLVEVDLGDSDELDAGDPIRVVGYPGIGESNAPQLNQGVVVGPVRDPRLNSNDAFLNVDADINQGNSGGGAFDNDGRLVGVPSQINVDPSTVAKANRIRPVNFAEDLIEAARTGGDYTSPYIWPLSDESEITELGASYDSNASADFTADCAGKRYTLSEGDEIVSLAVSYTGFGSGPHQDVRVDIVGDPSTPVSGSVTTNAQYPFETGDTGCMTVIVPLYDSDSGAPAGLMAGTYAIVVRAGPSYLTLFNKTLSLGSATAAPGAGAAP